MKFKITGFMAFVIIGHQALAAGQNIKIDCTFADAPNFGVHIEAGPLNEIWFQATAPAEIVVAGPRLYHEFKTELKKTTISTRVKVGIGYSAAVGSHSSINLEDIGWPGHAGGESRFTGVYYNSNRQINLICKYVQ